MANQINVPRLQYYQQSLSNFFNITLQNYFNSLSDSVPTVVLRLGNNLDIEEALRINPLCQRILFWEYRSFSGLNELYNIDGTIGENANYINFSFSMFFVGVSSENTSFCESLSYTLVQDMVTFFYENAGSFEFQTPDFTSQLVFTINNNLNVSGLERSKKVARDFFTTYSTDSQARISVYLN